jgi:hypothetical protein
MTLAGLRSDGNSGVSCPTGFASLNFTYNLAHASPRRRWKQVTPTNIDGSDQRLSCFGCGAITTTRTFAGSIKFADRHKFEHRTPLSRISQALRSTRCGERKAHCP